MQIITELQAQLAAVAVALGDDVEAGELARVVGGFGDEKVLTVLSRADALARGAERLRVVAAGVIAARSTREAGHEGLAQSRGHRTPASLVQELLGVGHAEAQKHLRVGGAMVQDALPSDLSDAGEVPGEAGLPGSAGAAGADGEAGALAPRPWHAPLSDALLEGRLTAAQHDAITRGLGEPPAQIPSAESDAARGMAVTGCDAASVAQEAKHWRDAWSLAATQLIDEAPALKVEALRQLARTVRDQLDPVGAERRFMERYEARKFRLWTDEAGLHHGHFTFDDFGAAWVRSIIDAALRPRRGGPRFVTPGEKARADELVNDPRTNDQLAYDLMMDVLHAGSLATAEQVFGVRQAGVRVVQVVDVAADETGGDETARDGEGGDETGRDGEGGDGEGGDGAAAGGAGASHSDATGPAHIEDGLHVIPGWLASQQRCETGTLPCRIDTEGNPLDVGREHRLFTPRQRIALALRDGGCRWRGCDRPASYCEAHHIDPYSQGGRTDIDRGVLLCRFHHMQLHNGGWRISRERRGEFELHPPGGKPPTPLRQPLALHYAWAGIDPPPNQFFPQVA